MLSVMLYPCMFCVSLSMDLCVMCVVCLTVFVNVDIIFEDKTRNYDNLGVNKNTRHFFWHTDNFYKHVQ